MLQKLRPKLEKKGSVITVKVGDSKISFDRHWRLPPYPRVAVYYDTDSQSCVLLQSYIIEEDLHLRRDDIHGWDPETNLAMFEVWLGTMDVTVFLDEMEDYQVARAPADIQWKQWSVGDWKAIDMLKKEQVTSERLEPSQEANLIERIRKTKPWRKRLPRKSRPSRKKKRGRRTGNPNVSSAMRSLLKG